MAPRPPKTPPMSRYGSQSSSPSSLQGLERAMHGPPVALEAMRRPVSPRTSSPSSVNKPLPPEPPAPLFACTPSPRSSPRPRPQPQPRALTDGDTRRASESGSRSGPGQTGRQLGLSGLQPRKDREGRADPADERPLTVDGPGSKSPKPGICGRPHSAMSRTTSIIDSYSRRNVTEPGARSETPLIAPHAQNSRVLSIQVERLQQCEALDSHLLSEDLPPPHIADGTNVLDGNMQRKDTLAYRFDTPTESEPQMIFKTPLWAMDPSETAEEVARSYRDTLPPSPFSPTSVYEDDEITSTPIIPVLPPLPMNSPFRLTGSTLDVNDNHTSIFNSRKASPAPSRPRSTNEHPPPQDQRSRVFGSQASWEPGDDSTRPRQASESTVSLNRPNWSRSPPPGLEGIQSKTSGVNRPLPSQHPAAEHTQAPQKIPVISLDKLPSGLPSVSIQRPDVSRSAGTFADVDDPGTPKSCWSDDSDDASKGLRSLGPRLRKRRKEIGSQSTTSTKSGASPANTNTSAPRERSSSNRRDALRSSKERRSLSESIDNSIGDMYDTLTKFSLGPRTVAKKPAQKEDAKSDVKAGQRSDAARDFPQSPTSATSLTFPVYSFMDRSARKLLAKKGKTWAIQLGGTKGQSDGDEEGDDESGGGTSPRSESGWLTKLRKKNRAEAQREKRREDLKRKIRIVQSEPQGMMAIVATREMRDKMAARSAAAEDEMAINHF